MRLFERGRTKEKAQETERDMHSPDTVSNSAIAKLPPACLASTAPLFIVHGMQKKIIMPSLNSFVSIGNIIVNPARVSAKNIVFEKKSTSKTCKQVYVWGFEQPHC